MKKLLLVAILGITSLMAADGAALYKKCIACHGAKGDKVPPGSKANFTINSLNKDKIVEDLKAYKNKTLNQYGLGASMYAQTAKLSDDDINALAEYVVTLKK